MPSSSAKILVFDVNETLLDLAALDPHFSELFGDARARQTWFARLLRMAMVSTVLDRYADFGVLAGGALDAVAAQQGLTLTAEQRSSILSRVRALPAHPDVAPGLDQLGQAGWRMVALTNSSPKMAEAQLTNAGIRNHFERVFSVDAVKRFKPAPEPYQMVARELNAEPGEMLMVAAHDWDIGGAMNAGLQGAFVDRPGQVPRQVLDRTAPRPTWIAADLEELADRLGQPG